MRSPAPAVSVIIPTYNRGSWLAETVESVLTQSFTDFELLVVDDGSTDDTASVMKHFPSVRYFRGNENLGVSYARNEGLRHAGGRYICFLDSDDLWKKDKLKSQVDWMDQRPEYVVSYTDEIWIRNGVRVNPMKKHQKCSGDIFNDCLPLCIVSPSSAMIRSELFDEIGNFDESLPACEDYDFWLRIAAHYPFHFIPRKLIVKRGGHPDQLSKKYWGMDRFRVQALEKLLKLEGLDARRCAIVRKTLVQKCNILSKGFLKRGKLEEANYYRQLAEKYSSDLDWLCEF